MRVGADIPQRHRVAGQHIERSEVQAVLAVFVGQPFDSWAAGIPYFSPHARRERHTEYLAGDGVGRRVHIAGHGDDLDAGRLVMISMDFDNIADLHLVLGVAAETYTPPRAGAIVGRLGHHRHATSRDGHGDVAAGQRVALHPALGEVDAHEEY